MDLIDMVWFASAITLLLFHRRLARMGSLVGVGTSIYTFAACLGTLLWIYIFPNEQMLALKQDGLGGYIISFLFLFVTYSSVLVFSAALFIGLLRLRKQSGST
jgi:hypothetical protein